MPLLQREDGSAATGRFLTCREGGDEHETLRLSGERLQRWPRACAHAGAKLVVEVDGASPARPASEPQSAPATPPSPPAPALELAPPAPPKLPPPTPPLETAEPHS